MSRGHIARPRRIHLTRGEKLIAFAMAGHLVELTKGTNCAADALETAITAIDIVWVHGALPASLVEPLRCQLCRLASAARENDREMVGQLVAQIRFEAERLNNLGIPVPLYAFFHA